MMKIEVLYLLFMAFALVTAGAAVNMTDTGIARTDAPLRINGDEDFQGHGFPGSGTTNDPYMIQGYEIDGGGYGYGIFIGNATVHFTLRNCVVFNATGRLWDHHYLDTGIYIYNSRNGTLENNEVRDNGDTGIRIYSSSNNLVNHNTLIGNRLGMVLSGSGDNTIDHNTISNEDIGLRLMNSFHNEVENNTVTGNDDTGVELFMSNGNYFYKNIVSNNRDGFYLEFSNNNTMNRNTVTENSYGINILDSQNNRIFHNNLMDNEIQGWDDGDNNWHNGFHSGGNYWSDHHGDDFYHGSDQNISGSDGIIDIPYYGHGLTDLYPLTDPSPRPHVRIDYPEDGDMISEESFTVMWTGIERFTDLLSYELRLNDDEWIDIGTDTEHIPQDLTDGEYILEVKVADQEGNTKTDTVGFRIDSPPVVEIISPSAGEIFSTHIVTIRWEGYDSMGIYYYEVRIDDEPWIDKDISTEHTFEDISNGERFVYVRAWDITGKNTIASVNFTVDTTPPEMEITSPGHGELLNRNDVTLEWTGEDETTEIDRYEVRVDGGDWIDVGKNEIYTFEGLSEGDHVFELRGWDTAGNSDIISINFTIDITPPDLSIISPSSGEVIHNTSVIVDWEGHDNSGINYYEVRIDDGDWIYMGKLTRNTFNELSDGEHTVEVRAWDNAGNNRTESVTFTVSTGLARYARPITLVVIGAVGAVLLYFFGFKRGKGGKDEEHETDYIYDTKGFGTKLVKLLT